MGSSLMCHQSLVSRGRRGSTPGRVQLKWVPFPAAKEKHVGTGGPLQALLGQLPEGPEGISSGTMLGCTGC